MGLKFFVKGDIIVYALIALLAVFPLFFFSRTGETAYVYSHGKLVAALPLDKPCEYKVESEEGCNTVTVRDGCVSVTESDCNNRVCVLSGAISKKGQCIVCLPHFLTVVIGEGEIDALG